MKTILLSLAACCILVANTAVGQSNPTRVLNWGTSFSPAWADGATSGSATNVAGSSTNVYVSTFKSGGTWMPSYFTAGNLTPSRNGSYNVGTLAPPNNLMLALDFNASANYIVMNIVFSRPVYKLTFSIADIDRHLRNRNDFMDEVVVEANYRTEHPKYKRYTTDAMFPAQLVFVGDTVRVNPNGFLSGNAGPTGYPANFDAAEQAGTVEIDFGNKLINSVRIRYGSARGSMPNPSVQAIAIGNISFTEALQVLPTAPTFNAALTNGGVLTQWVAPNETADDTYAVEHSTDGINFTALTSLSAQNKAAANYSYTHRTLPTGTAYYRLKMTNAGGAFSYSPVIAVKAETAAFTISKVYPTLFTNKVTLQADVPEAGDAVLCMYTPGGQLASTTKYALQKGANSLPVETPASLAPGTYLFSLRFKEETLTVKAVKQ